MTLYLDGYGIVVITFCREMGPAELRIPRTVCERTLGCMRCRSLPRGGIAALQHNSLLRLYYRLSLLWRRRRWWAKAVTLALHVSISRYISGDLSGGGHTTATVWNNLSLTENLAVDIFRDRKRDLETVALL